MATCYGMTRFEFDPERDLKEYTVWLCDLPHVPKPWPPLNLSVWMDGFSYGFQYGAERMSMPEIKGWDLRAIDGYSYLAVIECKPEEIPQREKVYRERIKPFVEDVDGKWSREMGEWLTIIDECKAFDVEKASNIELRNHFDDFLVRVHHGMWGRHMFWYQAIWSLYSLFTDLCEELIGIDGEHPQFKKLMTGFDNLLFQVNRGLWHLGDKATELGLDQLFLTTKNDEELLSNLETSEAGRKWFAEYREFLNHHGWRCAEVWNSSTPLWLEQPTLPLRDIKQAIAKGGIFVLDAERERLTKDRVETEREILAKVPVEQRDWFERLLRVSQKANVISEEHNYYLDIPEAALERRLFIEFGKRFARAGVIDDPEDIFFLVPEEIRKAGIPLERINMRPYVKTHKEEWEGYLKIEPKPFIGDITRFPEVARKDPILMFETTLPRVRPELKADLYGASSSPGVAEGIARIVINERDLDQVQPGDILVTVATGATWTPVFGIVAGVVTDAGSSLCHAAIVSREYGIPAVVGTQEATSKIKAGDRIKVDGNMNAVYILEKGA